MDAFPPLEETPDRPKLCQSCERVLPESEFIFTVNDRSMSGVRCRECHIADPERKRIAKEEAERADKFRDTLRRIAVKHPEAPVTPEVRAELFEGLNGVKGFVKFYLHQLNIMAKKNPGSGMVIKACEGIMKMVATSTQFQSMAPEVSTMTDDQLLEAQDKGFREFLENLPPDQLAELLRRKQKVLEAESVEVELERDERDTA